MKKLYETPKERSARERREYEEWKKGQTKSTAEVLYPNNLPREKSKPPAPPASQKGMSRKLSTAEVLYPNQYKRQEKTSAEPAKPAPPKSSPHKQAASQKTSPETPSNNPFNIQCILNEQGRLQGKTESSPWFKEEYQYVFDFKGRLERVFLNGELVEDYDYNEQGQRIKQMSAGNPPAYLRYNAWGQLVAMGDIAWQYDKNGALSKKLENALYDIGGSQTRYFYNGNTRLDKVILPNGDEITWKYGRGEKLQAQNPLKKYKNGKLVMEYEWQDPFRLAGCWDHEAGLVMLFSYGERLCPERMKIMGLKTKEEVSLICGCDQVGTLKLLSISDKSALKRLQYDSFGNVLHDTKPQLHIPIGFAGGLVDKDTGLVRFGYRDYDPAVGRFTCPDPLGDTDGDHDLYDYCVDDPVNSYDPTGLIDYPAWKKIAKTNNSDFAKAARSLGKGIQSRADNAESSMRITQKGGLFLANLGLNAGAAAADAAVTMFTHEGDILDRAGAILSGNGSNVIREKFKKDQEKIMPMVEGLSAFSRGDTDNEFSQNTIVPARDRFFDDLAGLAGMGKKSALDGSMWEGAKTITSRFTGDLGGLAKKGLGAAYDQLPDLPPQTKRAWGNFGKSLNKGAETWNNSDGFAGKLVDNVLKGLEGGGDKIKEKLIDRAWQKLMGPAKNTPDSNTQASR